MTEDKTPEVKIKLENVEIKELKAKNDIAYFLGRCILFSGKIQTSAVAWKRK